MPVFAALWAVVLYGERPGLRQVLSVAAAALGVALLLAHEFARLAGSPAAVAMALGAAAVWAFGTHELRRATLAVPLLTVVFWMTAVTAVLMVALPWPFAGARRPPLASSVSVMLIPVLGTSSVAWWREESLQRHDLAAMMRMVLAGVTQFTGAIPRP
jgi:drug/metabolite transporter (DMT)-like permease